MNAAELLWRLQSELQACVDIARIKLGALPRRYGRLPQGAFSATNLGAYRDSLGQLEKCALLDKADRILANRLSFFGHDDVPVGNPVDWHIDWNQQIRAPQGLSHFIDYRDAATAGDCKEVWEPNRHHQLFVLARAWAVTAQPRYAQKVAELLSQWIEANHYGYGMNWRSPLELAIRAINWVFAIDLVGPSAIDDALSERIHNAAYLHCWDVVRKFSRGSSANNHLIGEAAGVFIASSYWFPEQTGWIASAKGVLEEEIERQLYASGCTREQALSYQFFVNQFFILSALVGQRTNNPFGAAFHARLAASIDFLGHFEGFGDALPMFGDQDDGYVLDLGPSTHDVHDVLEWRAALSGETVEHAPSSLLGVDPARPLLPPRASHEDDQGFFDDAGYLVTAVPGGCRLEVLFDAGELGYGSMAAHGHADALQICVSIAGTPLLVDPGTYDYFTGPELRAYFRSTAAHNTIRLARTDQSVSAGPFMWSDQATSRLVRMESDREDVRRYRGEILEYAGLKGRVERLSRELELGENRIVIIDTIKVAAATDVEFFFHVHPDVALLVCPGESAVGLATASGEAKIVFDPSVRFDIVRDGELALYSPGYHRLAHGACIRCEAAIPADAETRFRTVITATDAGGDEA